MYSILILKEQHTWKYHTNPNGSQYIAQTLELVQAEVKELAKTIPLNSIVVVKNCTITEAITVVEDGAEQNQD